ncbi:MAG: cold shock domain-containing protein [Methylococcales bacterium]|nr:cold shock domain-containing protein [Methylococcales bacterium]
MKAEHKGLLKAWKDDRGFGFIKPDDGSEDLFIHISALQGLARRPYRGDIIFYQIDYDRKGKSKAINARIEGVDHASEDSKKTTSSQKGLWISLGVVSILIIATAYFYLQ